MDTFDIEQSHMCNFDYLAIYDALSGNLTSKLCGTYPENRVIFTSEGKDLLLHFHSDQSGSNKGFKLYLKFRTRQGLAESLDGDDGDSMTRKKSYFTIILLNNIILINNTILINKSRFTRGLANLQRVQRSKKNLEDT